jgi:hypothetical protein
MDRHNWDLPNANYYSHDYYSHDYYNQVDGQHASQPEAGQTSSGPSWSHPTQGQPRPYLDLNYPPPGGVDWHYSSIDNYYSQIHQQGGQYAFPPEAGQTSQSIALEAGIHNDTPTESSNPQPAGRYRRRGTSALVKEGFLGGLAKYAEGHPLNECSDTISFKSYITDKGDLHKSGQSVYDNLLPEERLQVDQAISARKEAHLGLSMHGIAIEERLLAALENYKSGKPMRHCATNIALRSYVTAEGTLQYPRGVELYKRSDPSLRERIDQALAIRQEIIATARTQDIPYFLSALVPYSNGLSLQMCGKQSGLEKKTKTYLTPEGGLTAKGELLVERLPQEQQDYVSQMLEQRRQRTEQSTQAQEPPRQQPEMPASMPEMGVMNQAAMTGPMQTEAMWATAWQLTGQAVPGTWGMPSGSAAPAVPYYDSDAVGADFQHQYGPMD